MATLIECEEGKSTYVKPRWARLKGFTSPREIFRQFPAGRCSFRHILALVSEFGSVTQLKAFHAIVRSRDGRLWKDISHLYVNNNAEKREKKESRQ